MNPEPSPDSLSDIRLFLQRDLLLRIRKNPRYSLRAYAALLKVNSGSLSRLLSGRRNFTPKLVQNFCAILNIGPEQTALFLEPFQEARENPARTVQFDQIALDHFHVIADWYHYALLELTRIEGFEPSASFVSRALGVPLLEIKAAVERLTRIGFLEVTPERWIDKSGLITTVGHEWTTPALRKLQKQILEKAISALEEVPYEFREQTSLTMAIDSRQLPQAKKAIREFNQQFTALIESAHRRDSVYHCSVSFYPVAPVRKDFQS